MAFSKSIKSGFITDLMLPPPGTNGKTEEEIERLAFETALGFMQDFLEWPRMNPLVYKVDVIHQSHPKAMNVEQLAADFGISMDATYALSPFVQHEIMDKLNVAFGYTTDLVYYSAMRKTTTGMEGLTDPGNGVKIYGRFEMRKATDQPSVIHLIETNETRCNVFLGVYIKATLGSSHKAMHENFKKKWNEEMKRKLAL